jgi:hypothetical protein
VADQQDPGVVPHVVLGRKTQAAIKLFGYAFGYAGIAYETLYVEEVNLVLLGIFVTLAGTPLAISADIKKALVEKWSK